MAALLNIIATAELVSLHTAKRSTSDGLIPPAVDLLAVHPLAKLIAVVQVGGMSDNLVDQAANVSATRISIVD